MEFEAYIARRWNERVVGWFLATTCSVITESVIRTP
jgi:hypothetical protein